MATISSPGLGSGLDVKSIVSQLVAIERKPIEAITKRTEALQAKLSAFGLLQSYTVNVQDAAGVIAKASTWQQTKAVSADATSVAVSSSTGAAAGTYGVSVTQLAQAQSLASALYTSSTAATGSGTLRIELGAWNADKSAFTPKEGVIGVDVVIPPGADSLETVRAAINAANAGVSASIVRDSTGVRLAIRSSATGETNAVRITATPDPASPAPPAPSLNDLVYNPPAGTPPMTETLLARNALATVNGLAVTSPNNAITDVIDGLTITLNKLTTAPVQLTVSTDTASMRKALDDFVKAYNEVNKYVRDQTKYDDDTKKGAALQGDRSTLTVLSQLRQGIGMPGAASTRYARLSDVGVQLQRDGSLKIDESKFNTAVSPANLVETARAISQDSDGTASDGFAVKLKALAGDLTGSAGVVSARTEGLRASIKRLQDQTAREEVRITQVEARLTRQYSSLDTKIAQLNGLNSYVSQQITNWNKSSS